MDGGGAGVPGRGALSRLVFYTANWVGYEDVSLYGGSWMEWGQTRTCRWRWRFLD